MKIAPLGLAGGRSYDRTNSLRTPTMKESQLLREKNHFLGLCFNVFKRCACPVSLTCIHTQHQAMWRRLLVLVVETLPIDRWHIARTTGEDLRARSIAIEVKHETLPAACCTSRSTASTGSRSTGMQAVGAGIVLRLVTVINRSWPVTMHDDQGPVEKEGRDGGPLKLLTWPFGRWTIDSSLP